MEKEILISIDSVQTSSDGEQDTISMVTEGTLTEKNGKQYITYQESELTGFAGCTTTLKIDGGLLTMLRFGPSNTQFVFQPNQCTSGIYHTPYGAFEVNVTTNTLQISMQNGQGDIQIEYHLRFGGNPASRHQFHIKITEKNKGGTENG
ncbi:MAG: DUF1934 domain-containing protein [Clostridia bacterium]|nr:DUF1934 domain-containing protein [Clostridia bacterium]